MLDDLLLERDFGQLTNSSHQSINFDALDVPSEENTRLGVEPLESVRHRTEQFLDKIKKTHVNDCVLIVGHNNSIRMMFGVLLDMTYHQVLSKYKIHNCGISMFEINHQGKVSIRKIDDTSHLVKIVS